MSAVLEVPLSLYKLMSFLFYISVGMYSKLLYEYGHNLEVSLHSNKHTGG